MILKLCHNYLIISFSSSKKEVAYYNFLLLWVEEDLPLANFGFWALGDCLEEVKSLNLRESILFFISSAIFGLGTYKVYLLFMK